MVGVDAVKGKFSKLVDVLMPPVTGEEELEDEVEVKTAQSAKDRLQAVHATDNEVREDIYQQVNGDSIHVEHPHNGSYEQALHEQQEKQNARRPHFTVHTTHAAHLSVQVYTPVNFDQVTMVADDLQDSKAVIVNYSKVKEEEQRRICDFVNGVCYVTDGCAKRISEQIVLYVPSGVDVSELEVPAPAAK